MTATLALSVFLATLAVSIVGTLLAVPILRRRGFADVPTGRSSHSTIALRGVGIAPAIALILAAGALIIVSSEPADGSAWATFLGASLVAAVLGFIEDARGLPASVRALAHLAIGFAVATAVSAGGDVTPLFFVVAAVGIAAYINVANFMDGVNGMSGFHAVVVGTNFVVVGVLMSSNWLVLVGVVIAAAFCGFLPFNLFRQGIFLGDTGSYLLGSAVATASVVAITQGAPFVAVVGPLVPYLVDTGVTLSQRVLAGERWFEPHRSHAYQRLVAHGAPHHVSSILVAVVSAATSALGVWAILRPEYTWLALGLMFVVGIGYLLLARRFRWGRPSPQGDDRVSEEGSGHSVETSVDERRLWVINHYASLPSKDGRGDRHFNLGVELQRDRWGVSLIVSTTTHPAGEQGVPGKSLKQFWVEQGIEILAVRTNAYGTSTLKRFIGMFVFAAQVLRPGATRQLAQPSAIMGSTVHPLAAWSAAVLARRHRVPFIFEIRDVWPDVLIDLGVVSAGSLAARAMRRLSVSLSKRADLIVSPLENLQEYLEDLGVGAKPFEWVSNGVSPRPLASEQALRDDTPFTFAYLGSLNQANALEVIVEAFAAARSELPPGSMLLHIVGDGPRRQELEDLARQLDCRSDVVFTGRVPESEAAALAAASGCLVLAMHDHPTYRYGVSPRKIFDYMLAARPVIFASGTQSALAAQSSGVIATQPVAAEVAKAMVRVLSMPESDRARLGMESRTAVMTGFTFEALAARLAGVLDNLVSQTARNEGQ